MSTKQVIGFHNAVDENDNPAGGFVSGVGLSISWQNGPLGRHAANCKPGETLQSVPRPEGCTRIVPNGAFVEDVLEICAERLRFYQSSKFRCRENAVALTHIETAILWLNKRTQEREARGAEGTHEL